MLRELHPGMGPQHVDTALIIHNLACCLDRLGKTHTALRLMTGALATFKVVLGNAHPRTQVAERNLGHVKHRTIRLEAHYK